MPALARMKKEATRILDAAHRVPVEIASISQQPTVPQRRWGKNVCALAVSGVKTTVVGASHSTSRVVWSATAAGLTTLQRLGNTSRKALCIANARPSCMTMWRNAAKACPLATPSTLRLLVPRSRAEILTTAFTAALFFRGNHESARAMLKQHGYILYMLSKSRFN